MIEKARFQAQCREQKEKLLKKYIDELKEIDAEINYEEESKSIILRWNRKMSRHRRCIYLFIRMRLSELRII